MFFSKVFLIVSSVILATQSFPQIKLQSLLPVDPIEEFDTWAWGEHPNGLGYKARNGLSVDQCLKNPHLIDTPACKFPAKLCMDVPEYATKQACAGNQYPAEFCATDIRIALLEGCAGNQIPAEFCATDIKIALLEGCADALYPKEFCVANPVLVSAKGCQKYLADICSLDVKLALSPPCADATYPKDFCVGNPVLISAKGCEKFKGDICTSSLELAESSSCSGAADQITRKQCTSNGDICRAKICDKRVPNKDFCKA
ncbi:uncharacterized protein LOC111716481 isoform X2 [Eurytemora carolleeae]|uniref:uncharacterized protein LOC111716481 isoform X2 n=1 Tax=Eurytemora carolleeae TaxID=1294199 RepID=UPI000C76237F|nr:uncharacterized protein LOC111716481 isoform X2 [Eurytemora carolleeae]|eukprot:XP_023347706.1 uncharacterized protein LOC111716481 isoform X2 [Eurytemora affinis]